MARAKATVAVAMETVARAISYIAPNLYGEVEMPFLAFPLAMVGVLITLILDIKKILRWKWFLYILNSMNFSVIYPSVQLLNLYLIYYGQTLTIVIIKSLLLERGMIMDMG